MTGFELQISGVGRNRSTSCTTTTARKREYFLLVIYSEKFLSPLYGVQLLNTKSAFTI